MQEYRVVMSKREDVLECGPSCGIKAWQSRREAVICGSTEKMRFFIVLSLLAAVASSNLEDLEKTLTGHLDLTKLKEVLEKLKSDIEQKLQQSPEEKDEVNRLLNKLADSQVTHGAQVLSGEDVTELNNAAGLDADLFEGDMMLTNEQLDEFQLYVPNNGSRARRQAQKGPRFPTNTWGKNPVIPYSFDARYPQDSSQLTNREAIKSAIKFWEDNTCIRFKETTAGSDRVKFIFDDGCYSYVGRIGGEQVVSIGDGCGSTGIVAHELSHTFGIFHVQSRFDRENYVLINKANIESNQLHNFDIESPQTSDNYGIPYEFGSNMHYGEGDFGLDRSKPALLAREAHTIYQHSMSNRLPTFYDITLVNKYYECDKNCQNKISCENGGIQDVNRCNQCLCPLGFTGTTCSQRPSGTKTVQVSSSPQSIFAEVGDRKQQPKNSFDNQYYLLQAPAGKRIELTFRQGAGILSTNCAFGGAEIIFKNDARLSGIKVCDTKVRQAPIVSEGNTMFINAYNRYFLSQLEFSARAV